jgi:hypothetical protein
MYHPDLGIVLRTQPGTQRISACLRSVPGVHQALRSTFWPIPYDETGDVDGVR